MAFVFIIAGIVLLTASIRNTQGDLFTLLKGDFTGPNNFIYWTAAILVVGSIGYIPKFKTFSVAFLTLIIIALFLNKNNQGIAFFQRLTQGLSTTTQPQSGVTINSPATGSAGPIASLPNLTNIFSV